LNEIIKNEINKIVKGEFSRKIIFIDSENFESKAIFDHYSEEYDQEIGANIISEQSHALIPLDEIEKLTDKKVKDGDKVIVNGIIYKLDGKPEITLVGMANIKLKLHKLP